MFRGSLLLFLVEIERYFRSDFFRRTSDSFVGKYGRKKNKKKPCFDRIQGKVPVSIPYKTKINIYSSREKKIK